MKWQIPAKTFLLGEYAAVLGESAIILTTSPCFEMSLVPFSESNGIPKESPAGLWWEKQPISADYSLSWHDPYQGLGGLGASSAQFLGAYMASCPIDLEQESLLDAYLSCAWQGKGLKPSGYDLIAQTNSQCVYINRKQNCIESYPWSFKDIAFVLLHSGQKLATHLHLQTMELPKGVERLSPIVEEAKLAFEQKNSQGLVQAVNAYQDVLEDLALTAPHSLQQIKALKIKKEILAVKGCGALGSDVLLLIVNNDNLEKQVQDFSNQGFKVLATSNSVYAGPNLNPG